MLPSTPDEIRHAFEARYDLPDQAILDMAEMGVVPSRKELANTVVLTLASAKLSFLTLSEEHLGEKPPRMVHEAAYEAQEGINALFGALSPDSAAPMLDGSLILDWLDGKGREPTTSDVKKIVIMLGFAKSATLPIADLTETLIREGDDKSNQIYVNAAWIHYVVNQLDCSCHMSERMRREGVNFDGLEEHFEDVVDAIRENEEEAERASKAIAEIDTGKAEEGVATDVLENEEDLTLN